MLGGTGWPRVAASSLGWQCMALGGSVLPKVAVFDPGWQTKGGTVTLHRTLTFSGGQTVILCRQFILMM